MTDAGIATIVVSFFSLIGMFLSWLLSRRQKIAEEKQTAAEEERTKAEARKIGVEADDILIGNWQDAAVWLRQELANTRETLKKERDEWANERKALRERIDDLETELAQEKATRQKESAELRKMLVNLQGT